VSIQLLFWAATFSNSSTPTIEQDRIKRERSEQLFENDSCHVAICGPTGCGKSSLLNALMGRRNGRPGTASTGPVETTIQREKYQGHPSFNSLILHDCPGAGTQRVPAENYYYDQRLYLFDRLLIVHGERLGQVEIDIIKACIQHRQRFVIVRSRSDELIRRIADDNDLDPTTSKERHVQITVNALVSELQRAEVPDEQIKELLGFCIFVNKNDLRELTIKDATQWPDSRGENEIHERNLLRYL
ncbi:interferon-inducible GTPase-domain-containing protein, partial [Halenospora varia]